MAIILDNVKFKTIIHLDTALQQKDDAIIIKLLLKVISNSWQVARLSVIRLPFNRRLGH